MKTLFYINYELNITYWAHSIDVDDLDIKSSDLHNYSYLEFIELGLCSLKFVDLDKYNFAFSNGDYDTLEDKICSLRLQAEILEKLNEAKNVNLEVSFNLNKKTNEVSYKLVRYKGHEFFKKLIKDKLDKFCKEKKVKNYIWGDEFK